VDDSLEDAVVEPVEVGDPERALQLAHGSTPQALPASVVRTRERVRSGIAIGMVTLTAAAGIAGGWATLVGSDQATSFLSGIFTPLLGVTGTVLGFYFSGKESGP
jgi:hypothetical protein